MRPVLRDKQIVKFPGQDGDVIGEIVAVDVAPGQLGMPAVDAAVDDADGHAGPGEAEGISRGGIDLGEGPGAEIFSGFPSRCGLSMGRHRRGQQYQCGQDGAKYCTTKYGPSGQFVHWPTPFGIWQPLARDIASRVPPDVH